ncbi:MAG: hypothetical protein ACE5HQ_10790 [Gemmatimonadota bacterium]
MISDPLTDRELRQRFVELRREVLAAAPPFEPASSLRRRGERRPARLGWRAVLVSAMVVTLALGAVLGLFRSGIDTSGGERGVRPDPRFEIDLSTARWVAPSDFLLRTPGQALLGEVPSVGARALAGPPGSSESPAAPHGERRNRT